MKKLILSLAAPVLIVCLISHTQAQTEVTLIATGNMRPAIQKLIPGYETKTGNKVKVTFGTGASTRKQVAEGVSFDVSVLRPPYPEAIASGNVIIDSAKPIASISVGVAVKKGAPKPDISTPEAVKKMLLAAKSIAYPDPPGGAAALSFDETLKKLGISEQTQINRARGTGDVKLVAAGGAEIGFTWMTEMSEPGIDIVGPLPKAISTADVVVGFIATQAKDPAAAKALLDYLASPEAASVYKEVGMEPGAGLGSESLQ